MRKVIGTLLAITLVTGVAFVANRPGPAGAQGGGTIEATVTYAGAPVVEKLKVNKDLANVVVSVPDAKGGAPKAVKTTVDQHGCKFVQHVTAMMPGEMELKNSDDILHNIHTYSTANPSINKAQPKFKKVMTEKFEKPEIIKLTCDVHSWMLGWLAVMPNPYFGVTGGDGTVKIE